MSQRVQTVNSLLVKIPSIVGENPAMLTTGNQLRAARALVDMDQGTLAARAGVNVNTIGSMEKRGALGLVSGLDKVQAVMRVLESEGIEFLNHGEPGVRLRRKEA